MSGRRSFYTPKELAEVIGVPAERLARWRTQGKGPRSYKFEGSVRYSIADVQEWAMLNRSA